MKPVADNSFFMQLDDSTTLLPVNMKNSPYGEKEVRPTLKGVQSLPTVTLGCGAPIIQLGTISDVCSIKRVAMRLST